MADPKPIRTAPLGEPLDEWDDAKLAKELDDLADRLLAQGHHNNLVLKEAARRLRS